MNNSQENQLTMFDASLNLLDTRQDVTSKLPIYAGAIQAGKDKTAEIRAADAAREMIFQGITEEKKRERMELESAVFKTATSMYLYGEISGNSEFTDAFDFDRSDVSKLRDQQIINTATTLHDSASAILTELTDYGITAEVLARLIKERDDFAALISESGSASAEGKAATINLKKLFSEARDIFEKRLDKLADFFRDSDPDFFEEYTAARRIIDRGIRHDDPEEDEPEG